MRVEIWWCIKGAMDMGGYVGIYKITKLIFIANEPKNVRS